MDSRSWSPINVMAVFKFHLAPLLQFRHRIREEKEHELQALNNEFFRRQNEIAEFERRLAVLADSRESDGEKLLSPADLQFQDQYSQQLLRLIEERRVALNTLESKRAAKMAELIAAVRDVKSLEKLRERLEAKFCREQALHEQKFTDEIGQRKFIHGRGRK